MNSLWMKLPNPR